MQLPRGKLREILAAVILESIIIGGSFMVSRTGSAPISKDAIFLGTALVCQLYLCVIELRDWKKKQQFPTGSGEL